MVAMLKALWEKVKSWLCRVHVFLGRHRCLRGLLILFAAVLVAVLWSLFFAPDQIRQATLSIEKRAKKIAQVLPASLPPATKIDSAHWLPQNWSERDRYWFHHTPQGTATFPIPYNWFLALERPEISLFRHPGYLRDEAFMRRLGFIPSPDIDVLRRGAPQYGYRNSQTIDPTPTTPRDRATDYPRNPYGLPVGFAKLNAAIDPASGERHTDLLGLTCAACHTGHIEYRNVSIRFDGGPAMVNLGELERAIALSLAYTIAIPTRFNRFANEIERISGETVDRDDLKEQLKDTIAQLRNKKDIEDNILDQHDARHVTEGFGRLDALNRIGNQVFFANMLPRKPTTKDKTRDLQRVLPDTLLAANFARIDAPVSFPPIWSASWFSWAQYDASVQNELVRNAGEALGVNAKVNLRTYDDPKLPTFSSSVQMLNIFWFESLLAGEQHPLDGEKGFKGLLAPKWADAAALFPGDPAWDINKKLAAEGRDLYGKHCAECHRPPLTDQSFWDGKHWVDRGGKRYLDVVQKRVDVIGTDRQQARVLTERRVNLPARLKLRPIAHLNEKGECRLPGEEPNPTPGDSLSAPFVLALMAVVDRTIARWFEETQNEKYRPIEGDMRGTRKNCQNGRVFRTVQRVEPKSDERELAIVPHYRARPLDGVWATAPYLHNGSVPTLQDMLVPQHQRPKVFCVGNRQFDPLRVGLVGPFGGPCGAYTRFDANDLGSSNLGHSFEGKETDIKKLPNGVIGPELTQHERDALVEYLKTL